MFPIVSYMLYFLWKGDQSIWSGFSIGYKMVCFELIVLETAEFSLIDIPLGVQCVFGKKFFLIKEVENLNWL